MMKGHMQDGKFHPHTDYKKGVRKSRDQKTKTQGVELCPSCNKNPKGSISRLCEPCLKKNTAQYIRKREQEIYDMRVVNITRELEKEGKSQKEIKQILQERLGNRRKARYLHQEHVIPDLTKTKSYWQVVLENPIAESGTTTHIIELGRMANKDDVINALMRMQKNGHFMYFPKDLQPPYLHSIERLKRDEIRTIQDLDGRDDFDLVQTDTDVEYFLDFFGLSKDAYDGLFIKVKDGDVIEAYGFEGIIPALHKGVDRIETPSEMLEKKFGK